MEEYCTGHGICTKDCRIQALLKDPRQRHKAQKLAVKHMCHARLEIRFLRSSIVPGGEGFGKILVKFTGTHVDSESPSAWQPPIIHPPPGDRALCFIERNADVPGSVAETSRACHSSPGCHGDMKRAPTAAAISQVSRNIRKALGKQLAVEGDWSALTVALRETFIPDNLTRLEHGEPGLLAFWQDEMDFMLVVSKKSMLDQFSAVQDTHLLADDKVSYCVRILLCPRYH